MARVDLQRIKVPITVRKRRFPAAYRCDRCLMEKKMGQYYVVNIEIAGEAYDTGIKLCEKCSTTL